MDAALRSAARILGQTLHGVHQYMPCRLPPGDAESVRPRQSLGHLAATDRSGISWQHADCCRW